MKNAMEKFKNNFCCGKIKHELGVTSSNPRVRRQKTRVAGLKAQCGRLKARVGRLKVRVEAVKPRVR